MCSGRWTRRRQLAQRIYPPLLEAGGLTAALRSAAASIGVPSSIDVDAGDALPARVAGTVYLCCLEALEHADAGSAGDDHGARRRRDELAFEVVGPRGGPPDGTSTGCAIASRRSAAG